MSKGNNKRGNREIKKPKQIKIKLQAEPVSTVTKARLNIAGKKI